MQAVFLCGGAGRRMLPLSGDKSLISFLGRTLLEHRIEQAVDCGVSSFVLVGNRHNIDRLRDIAARFPKATFSLADQGEPSGMAEALLAAKDLLDDDVLVLSPADVLDESAYHRIMDERESGTASSFLLGARVDRHFPGSYLVVDEEKAVRRVVEKPDVGAGPSDTVSIAVHLHRDAGALLSHLAGSVGTGPHAYERALQSMLDDGFTMKLVEYTGRWCSLKYPWHVLDVMECLLAQAPGRIAPSAVISERATIEGRVTIGENVRILENAVVRGPCYVGPNSVVGNNALIRDGCHIGAGCVVGFSTEVKHSYIGDGCWFHHSYIGDSVVGDGCSFGAGTVTANVRFDESDVAVGRGGERVDSGRDKLGAIVGDGCKTGINVSIMPGVRIGPHSIVGPHVLLQRDVEANTMVLVEEGKGPVKRALGVEKATTQE